MSPPLIDDDAMFIDDQDQAQSWVGMFKKYSLSLAIGAIGIIVYFFYQQQSAPEPLPTLDEDEREKRRQHLAKIAERRSLQQQEQQKQLQQQQRNDRLLQGADNALSGASGATAKKNQAAAAKKSTKPRGAAATLSKSTKVSLEKVNEKKTKSVTITKKIVDRPESGSNDTPTPQTEQTLSLEAVDSTKTSALTKESQIISQNIPDQSGEGKRDIDSIDTEKQEQLNLIKTNEDKQSPPAVENGHRERHEMAIAKILAKKKEKESLVKTPDTPIEEPSRKLPDSSQPPILIYLLLTSSPQSPRQELSIPATSTASDLRHLVADATTVPLSELRLVFRGRIITDKIDGCVVDKLGIENESALHVVGKPRSIGRGPQAVAQSGGGIADDDETPTHDNSQSIEEEEDGGEEDLFSDGYGQEIDLTLHRAAARGDLDTLRAAVNTSDSQLLDAADSNMWTPLHEAVRSGHDRIVQFLIEDVGADVNAITNQGNGWSPLALAIRFHGERHAVIDTLRQHGARAIGPEFEEEENLYD